MSPARPRPAPGPCGGELRGSLAQVRWAHRTAPQSLGVENLRPRPQSTNTRFWAREFPSETRDGIILTRERGGFFLTHSVLFRGYDPPQATSASGLRNSKYRRPDGRRSGEAAPGGAGLRGRRRARARGLCSGPGRRRSPPRHSWTVFSEPTRAQYRAFFWVLVNLFRLLFFKMLSRPRPTLGSCRRCRAVSALRACPSATQIPGAAHTAEVSTTNATAQHSRARGLSPFLVVPSL